MNPRSHLGFTGLTRPYGAFEPKEAEQIGGVYIDIPGSYQTTIEVAGSYQPEVIIPGEYG
jgi:hypothetical protein